MTDLSKYIICSYNFLQFTTYFYNIIKFILSYHCNKKEDIFLFFATMLVITKTQN